LQSRARQVSQLSSAEKQPTPGFVLHQNPWSPIQLYSIYRLIVLSVVAIFSAHFQWPSYMAQVYLQPVTDIIFLLLLIFSSGGLHSGMGLLLGLPIILQNVLRPGQVSLMITAIAISCLLGVEAYMQQEAARSDSD